MMMSVIVFSEKRNLCKEWKLRNKSKGKYKEKQRKSLGGLFTGPNVKEKGKVLELL